MQHNIQHTQKKPKVHCRSYAGQTTIVPKWPPGSSTVLGIAASGDLYWRKSTLTLATSATYKNWVVALGVSSA